MHSMYASCRMKERNHKNTKKRSRAVEEMSCSYDFCAVLYVDGVWEFDWSRV